MARIHVFIGALGLALLWAPPAALAQTAPVTQGPILIPPAYLPDLAFTATKMWLSCAADKKSLTANFTFTLQNKGLKGNANLSQIPFQTVVDALVGTTVGDGNLEPTNTAPIMPSMGGPVVMKPADTIASTFKIVGIPHHKKTAPAYAQYALVLRADPKQGVGESDEKNNLVRQYFKDPCPK